MKKLVVHVLQLLVLVQTEQFAIQLMHVPVEELKKDPELHVQSVLSGPTQVID
jgi:hypothetical protein